MKVTIRKNTFETNSSSVHTICIAKEPANNFQGSKIFFELGDFGWAFESVNRADYLYTAIMTSSKTDEYLDKLKAILDKNDIIYGFAKPKYYDDEHRWIENGGIDHSYELEEFLEVIMNDEDMLLRFLFNNDSAVYTGNDNSDGYWRYETAYQGFKEARTDDGEYIDNSYHNEDKFDYFVKGN